MDQLTGFESGGIIYHHYKISGLKSVKSTLWKLSQCASLFHEVLWF